MARLTTLKQQKSAEDPVAVAAIEAEIKRYRTFDIYEARELWKTTFKREVPKALTRDLLVRMLAWHIQEQAFGGHDRETLNLLDSYAKGSPTKSRRLKAGTVLIREHKGERHTVTVVQGGFIWRETTYPNLSVIAGLITGTNWNGPRFFGLRDEGTRRGGTGKSINASVSLAGVAHRMPDGPNNGRAVIRATKS